MNTAVKKRWLKALRSGEYRKARGRLAGVGNRRCCLWVLRDVTSGPERDSCAYLRLSTLEKCGLVQMQQADLATLNDKGLGWDAVIAYIEEEL